MQSNEQKYVTKEILTYYDAKIKDYIAKQIQDPKSDIDSLVARVNDVETACAVNTANLKSAGSEIEQANSSIIALEASDKELTSTISDLRVDVATKVEQDYATATYATKEYVNQLIGTSGGADIDTTLFATKEELKEYAKHTEVCDLSAAVSGLDGKFEIVSNDVDELQQNLLTLSKDHVTLSELTSYGYATKDYVDALVAGVESGGSTEDVNKLLSNYYTKDLTYNKLEVDAKIPTKVSQLTNDSAFLTEIPDEYAKKSDIPTDFLTSDALNGYATETFVKNAIAEAELNGGTDIDLSGYATKDDIKSLAPKAYVDQKVSEIVVPSVEGLASEAFVQEEIAKIQIPDVSDFLTETEVNELGFLKEVPENYVQRSELDDYVKDGDLNLLTLDEVASAGFIKSDALNGYAKTEDIPDTTDCITTSVLTDTLKDYAKTGDIPNDYIKEGTVYTKVEADDAFMTETKVDEKLKGYSTFSGNYADLTGAPTKLSEFANDSKFVTDTELTGKKYLVAADIAGKLDTTTYNQEKADFATKSAVEDLTNALGAKADTILFTSDAYVKNPIGNFTMDESVKGMTLQQLFTALLGLSTAKVPETPEEVVDYIQENDVPAKVLDTTGNLVDATYAEMELTAEDLIEAPDGSSFFYVVKDSNGAITESGYQLATIYNDTEYLTVAFPDYVTSVQVVGYNILTSQWEKVPYELTPVESQTIDGYTVWTADGIDSGETLRFIIL